MTAQHREMLDQVLSIFSIKPDYDLDVMREGQDLLDITAHALQGLKEVLRIEKPDVVLVHGDTTTCFVAGLAAFYEEIPFGHVEAGLRTGNLRAPFPEEANRSLVARIANYHFAPTPAARFNLLAEGVMADRIWVTGNTVIDALIEAREMLPHNPAGLFGKDESATVNALLEARHARFILVTGHRRENFGQGFRDLCGAIRNLALRHPDWIIVYPVHLNPNVRGPVRETLEGIENVHLIDPVGYLQFVWLMTRCDIILTDSGGIQEEGPALGKPVLVMRDVTERSEALNAGTVKLVGTSPDRILGSVEGLLQDEGLYRAMANATNPYGDGHAAARIVEVLHGEGQQLNSPKAAFHGE